MDNNLLKEKIQNKLPEVVFNTNPQFVEVVVPAEKINDFCKFLKTDNDLKFDYLFCLSGVDFLKHFAVVYHVTSTTYNHSMVVKVLITDRKNPAVDSVCDVWRSADFHEREIFDLFGIHFNNHPDLRRMFLEDDWVGFPLRKDYVDTVNIVER